MAEQASPHSSKTETPTRGLYPELPAHKEAQILRRVKGNLLTHLREEPQPAVSWMPRLAFAALPAALAVFVLWRVFVPLAPKQHPMQLAGQIQIAKDSSTRRLQLLVPPQKTGAISFPKRWSAKLEATTHASLIPHPTTQTIRLQRGAIQASVVPGATKHFEIRTANARVLVKGTRFSVEKEKTWTRIEVTKGRVLVKLARREVMLTKGQALRIDNQKGSSKRYLLPPQGHRMRALRLAWVERHQPALFARYTMDLVQSPRFRKSEKAQWLNQLAEFYRQRKEHAQAQRAWLQVYGLQVAGGSSENALYNAARYCRQSHKDWIPHCLSLYRRYMKRYKHGLWRSYASFWIAIAQTKDKEPKHGFALLQKYVQAYPQGYYHQNARLLLIRRALEKGRSCRSLGSLLSGLRELPSWLKQRCPSTNR